MFASLILAVLATLVLAKGPLTRPDIWKALLVGILATPLAPVAKALATALTTAVNAMQLVNKGGRA